MTIMIANTMLFFHVMAQKSLIYEEKHERIFGYTKKK